MSIIITNVSKHDDLAGANDYVVRINERVVAKFSHIRRDGLAQCLRRAADAFEREEAIRAALQSARDTD